MSSSLVHRPLIPLALPQDRAARFAMSVLVVLGGTLLLALSAKTKVVLGPVDLSLQTLVILLIAATFGFRLGVATLVAYMIEGALGLPVFQSTPERGIGLAYMMGTTGGFLAGFVVMAAIVGWAVDRGWDRSIVKLGAAMLTAEVVMMAMGFAWLAALIGVDNAWTFGVAPFILPDLVKVAIAALAVPAARGLIERFSA